jgi:hypothetical protein
MRSPVPERNLWLVRAHALGLRVSLLRSQAHIAPFAGSIPEGCNALRLSASSPETLS